jgi:hypothetical protein
MSMKPENLLGYICGIDQDYEVMVVGVFIKNNSVQLLGPDGSHQVHSSNNFDMDGYKREAAIVWDLTDMFEIARDRINSPEVAEKTVLLKRKAAEMKTAAEKKEAARQQALNRQK